MAPSGGRNRVIGASLRHTRFEQTNFRCFAFSASPLIKSFPCVSTDAYLGMGGDNWWFVDATCVSHVLKKVLRGSFLEIQKLSVVGFVQRKPVRCAGCRSECCFAPWREGFLRQVTMPVSSVIYIYHDQPLRLPWPSIATATATTNHIIP